MKICVLSGSPKGQYSITYQTVLFLEKLYPDCTFETLQVGQSIKKLEKDFSPAKTALECADLILFCYPVYTFIVPYQLHRFIELMKEHAIAISGKCAIQISTSKHFYDVTAHDFIRENCDDLQLRYLGGLSLDMEDLLHAKGQKHIKDFWELVKWRYESGICLPQKTISAVPAVPYTRTFAPIEKVPGKKIVIVSSGSQDDAELTAMIDDFRDICAYETTLIKLEDFPFKGGCLGCLNCATSGKCVYRDGFDEFLRGTIQTGACILYAFRVKDHSMGSLMKLYDDRQFCNGHRTVTMGMPIGYLVAGNLESEANLNMILTARADVGGNFLAGIATDADGIKTLAETLRYALENKIEAPSTFYGIGGTRIFRDLIWTMRGIMQADHKFFKEHGLYDFPQKKRGVMMKMKLVGALLANPKIKAKIGNKMNEGMLAPYQKVLKELDESAKP